MLRPKPADLIVPGRFFVREGELFLWNQKKGKKTPRYFFLFNDVLLLTKKKGKSHNKFLLRVHITLRSQFTDIEDVKSVGTYPEFRVHCRTRSFILYTTSQEEKEAWVRDMRNSITGEHPQELQEKGGEKKKKSQTDAISAQTKERSSDPNLVSPRKKQPTDRVSESAKPRSSSVTTLPKKAKKKPDDANTYITTKPAQNSSRTRSPKSPDTKSFTASPIDNDSGIFIYPSYGSNASPFSDVPSTYQNPFLTNPEPRPPPTLNAAPVNPFMTGAPGSHMSMTFASPRQASPAVSQASLNPALATQNPFMTMNFATSSQPVNFGSTQPQPVNFGTQPVNFGAPQPQPVSFGAAQQNPFMTMSSGSTNSGGVPASALATNPFMSNQVTSPRPFDSPYQQQQQQYPSSSFF
eukprot:TRINITY_DN1882_c0_g1_i2.p1 TRINITY_DN1882_c0_g1~~TRINITY_DN1882_c0_g1_i2.p1  ORF type:complete len:426 (-),score=93.70 TRINITY_DN1882_c0_g1_i2:50-1273(-)